MNEPKVEIIPEAAAFMENIQKTSRFNAGQRAQLEELFKAPAFCSALAEILYLSDERLKIIGQTDLTNEKAIQNGLKAQGIAQGLVEAVELICTLAATPENPQGTEENENDN